MCRKLIYLFLIVLALSVTCGPAAAGVLYGNPPGGWMYIHNGTAASNADGTWDHDNGSDVWDGTGIGAGELGGISALVEGAVDFVRVQDALTSGGSRKIYFTHQLTLDPGMTQATADQVLSGGGITMSFRARLSTTPPLDGTWPAGGDGYVIHDGGKGPFGIYQGAGDQIISFGLVLAGDPQGEPKIAGRSGLCINNLNGTVPSGTVDIQGNEAGTLSMLDIANLTIWHEFWITIQPDTSGGGTHLVKICMDGSMTPTEFHVTAGDGNEEAYSYLAMGCGASPQLGAIDMDFFAYKPGLYSPGAGKKASQPIPADKVRTPPTGTSGTGYFMLLEFTAGDTATSHTAYFSSKFDDVNDRTPAFRLGSPPYPEMYPTGYYVGLDVPELPAFARVPLRRGTIYYWAVDESNGVGSYPGDVWSFTIAAQQAWDPTPPNGDQLVNADPDVALSWKLGDVDATGKTVSYDVYYGTVFADVNTSTTPTVHVTTTSAVTGSLLGNAVYYWRVDTVLTQLAPPFTSTKVKGDVWNFKTLPVVAITDPDLVGWWKLDGDIVPAIAFDSSGYGNHGAIVGGAQRAPGKIGEAIELNGSGQNVAIAGFDEITGLPALTIAMWVKADDVTGEHYMWFTHETSGYGKVRCLVNGGNWIWRHGQGAAGNNPEVTSPATAGVWTHYAAVRIDNDQLYLYINGSLMAQTAFAAPGGAATNSWIGAQEGTGQYFDGLIDDVRVYSKALSAAEIRIAAGLFEAYDPLPPDEGVGVATTPTLSWLPGGYAASHNVYFGTSYADVKAGAPGTFKGSQPLGDTDYVPSPALTAGKVYYWKITEVNDLHADKKWEGPVWVFRVAGGAGGLLGAYYQHTGGASPAGFETFKLSRIDPEVNFNWGIGSPDPLVDINDFSCRWSGQVEVPFSENYSFYTATDDGARLWVDGQLVIDRWVDQGGTEWPSAPVALVAGQKYDIVMEQYENEGGAAAYLRWSSPSRSKRIIPAIWLWPPTKATNPVPPDGSTSAPPQQPTLSWTAGVYAAIAAGHRVYFDADQAKVIARAGCQVNGISTTNPSYILPWTFGLEETYYWAVDEVNGVKSWPGDTWSFTTANNKVVDDMEKYVPNVANPTVYQVWVDGAGDCASIPGNNTGALVDISTLTALGPVHGGQQAMKLMYDNDGTVDNPCPPGVPTARLTYSKAEALVAKLPGIGSDWTAGGVTKALSLWFYGDPLNLIEPMWVRLTDASNNTAKVLYGKYADEDVKDVNEASWHEWLIDLADFTGVNVANVKSIAIGVGNEPTGPAGGSGTLYFDDIRLYTPRCVLTRRSADFAKLDYAPEADGGDCVINASELEVMTRDWLLTDSIIPAEAIPPAAHLLVNYRFELNTLDSSTNALHGTPGGAPTYELRAAGDNAIVLAGSDYVNCGNPPQLDFGTGDWSVCAWIKTAETADAHTVFAKGGDQGGGIRYTVAIGENGPAGCVTLTTDDDTTKLQATSTRLVNDNEWHHVVGQRAGTTLRVYVDAIPDGTNTCSPAYNLAGASQHNAYVGAITDHTDLSGATLQKFFVGSVADLRIYDYALTQGQIITAAGLARWHIPVPSPAELYEGEAEGSRVINFRDYAVLTDRWLEEDMYP